MKFRQFLETSYMDEEKQDVQKTLAKLPPSHAALVNGFQWKFHAGNTLDGDTQHVGYMDSGNREIAVAAPYNYGREFTILHEIAHRVWEHMNSNLKRHWNQLAQDMTDHQKQDKSVNQEPEEKFCMAYAQHYAKNKLVKFANPKWDQFIAQLPA